MKLFADLMMQKKNAYENGHSRTATPTSRILAGIIAAADAVSKKSLRTFHPKHTFSTPFSERISIKNRFFLLTFCRRCCWYFSTNGEHKQTKNEKKPWLGSFKKHWLCNKIR